MEISLVAASHPIGEELLHLLPKHPVLFPGPAKVLPHTLLCSQNPVPPKSKQPSEGARHGDNFFLGPPIRDRPPAPPAGFCGRAVHRQSETSWAIGVDAHA